MPKMGRRKNGEIGAGMQNPSRSWRYHSFLTIPQTEPGAWSRNHVPGFERGAFGGRRRLQKYASQQNGETGAGDINPLWTWRHHSFLTIQQTEPDACAGTMRPVLNAGHFGGKMTFAKNVSPQKRGNGRGDAKPVANLAALQFPDNSTDRAGCMEQKPCTRF